MGNTAARFGWDADNPIGVAPDGLDHLVGFMQANWGPKTSSRECRRVQGVADGGGEGFEPPTPEYTPSNS